jgi:hypothetical protein
MKLNENEAWFKSDYTGMDKEAKELLIEKNIISLEQSERMTTSEIETEINKHFYCFYTRSKDEYNCDMETAYLLPKDNYPFEQVNR